MKATTEKLLQWCLLSEICQKSGDYFVFQQDGTPSYWAKSTVEFLQRIMTNFIEPSVCPPIARTWLTTLYWGALQQNMYRIPISNLDYLKDRVRTCWENLDQQIIDKSIDHWRDRLKAVARVNGGHIEQLFWLSGSFAAMLCSVAYAF